MVVKVMKGKMMIRVIMKIQKQSFADVLQNRDSKKFNRKTPVL